MFRNVGVQQHRNTILHSCRFSGSYLFKVDNQLAKLKPRCEKLPQFAEFSTDKFLKFKDIAARGSKFVPTICQNRFFKSSSTGNLFELNGVRSCAKEKHHLHLPPLSTNLTHVNEYSTESSADDESKKKKFISRLINFLKIELKPKIDVPGTKKIKFGNNEIFASAKSKEEADKLKMAFTDGYLVASKQSPAPPSRLKKIISPILTFFVISGVFICLFIIVSGTVFRSQMGKYSEINPEDIHVTFRDVKGAEEAKQELKEIVAFLRNPEKFSILGGKLPKGVLLVGPPGTGKTLLARAVAGEAKVPFFHAAGPEFDEVLVGQGARRVRDLFKAAKEAAPCVIFIDEIDSVGSKRTNSMLHPYANQTVNQLLSEMDGFHQNEGVIVLGATNRRNDLDKALLRPGRFDVEVSVTIPDYSERKEIIEYYVSKVLNKNIDVDVLARGTAGFTGADLENMINQAALKAAIEGADSVTMSYIENAKDKILMGPERKSRIPDKETNLITAYHEGGHTIVCFYTSDSKPLHKVTILPRGRSLGHTAYIPDKEQYLVKKSQLLATMDTLMGGRAAEEVIFGPDKITTGASNDLKEATSIATHMVKDWGMSEKVGLRTFEGNQGSSEAVDAEISWLLQESYKRAKTIIKNYSRELKLLVEALLKYETLDADDVKAILMERRKN